MNPIKSRHFSSVLAALLPSCVFPLQGNNIRDSVLLRDATQPIAQDGLNATKVGREVSGFLDVVVRAELEATWFLDGFLARADHDDRGCLIGRHAAQLSQNGAPLPSWQGQV